jgi:hypothetical protein
MIHNRDAAHHRANAAWASRRWTITNRQQLAFTKVNPLACGGCIDIHGIPEGLHMPGSGGREKDVSVVSEETTVVGDPTHPDANARRGLQVAGQGPCH